MRATRKQLLDVAEAAAQELSGRDRRCLGGNEGLVFEYLRIAGFVRLDGNIICLKRNCEVAK